MSKVCVACGLATPQPKKPEAEPEDCPDCGGQDTMQSEEKEQAEAEEEKENTE